MSRLPFLALLVVPAAFLGTRSPKPLIVHEWGTITTHHRPNGAVVGGLNRIDSKEVLPDFVVRYEPEVTRSADRLLKTPSGPGRADITMRLETPVIYFHVPEGTRFAPFNLDVDFRGGVLNEFYPTAKASLAMDAQRLNDIQKAGPNKWDGITFNSAVKGSLHWEGITLKDSVALLATNNHTWLAPRKVNSSGVQLFPTQSERYLFYRGVAHLDALMQTEFTSAGLTLRSPSDLSWMPKASMQIPRAWVMDVRADGTAAFREMRNIDISRNSPSCDLATAAPFTPADYTPTKLTELRATMRSTLIASGLNVDEAEAMFETWRESWLTAPGTRVLYMVPTEWTNYYLPMRVSIPAEITRVMVGRIDILAR